MPTAVVPPYTTAGAQTINGLCYEARVLLQDLEGTRYADEELLEAYNGAMVEARAKRPDVFLAIGLRVPVPLAYVTDLTATPPTPFPLTSDVYTAFLYYVVGRCEMRDDTFSVDGRAVALMNKFVSQLLGVQS